MCERETERCGEDEPICQVPLEFIHLNGNRQIKAKVSSSWTCALSESLFPSSGTEQDLSSPRWQQKQHENLLSQLLIKPRKVLKGAETRNLYDQTDSPCWHLYLGWEAQDTAIEEMWASIVLREERLNTELEFDVDWDMTACYNKCEPAAAAHCVTF